MRIAITKNPFTFDPDAARHWLTDGETDDGTAAANPVCGTVAYEQGITPDWASDPAANLDDIVNDLSHLLAEIPLDVLGRPARFDLDVESDSDPTDDYYARVIVGLPGLVNLATNSTGTAHLVPVGQYTDADCPGVERVVAAMARIVADANQLVNQAIDMVTPTASPVAAGELEWASIDSAPLQDDDGAARTVTVTGVAAQFSGDELDCLARTAGEAIYGDIEELSGRQIILAKRAFDAHMADVTAEPAKVCGNCGHVGPDVGDDAYADDERPVCDDIDACRSRYNAGIQDALRAVAEQVKARGHHAEVESGGGNVPIIVAGRQAHDAAGDLRWSAVVDTDELTISPEYDLDAPPVPIPAWSTTAEIVDLIVAVVEQDTRPMLFPEPGSKVRFQQKVAGTPDPDGWVQEIDVPPGTVGVYQRPVGFPYTPPDGWIWATVELDGQTVWVPAAPDMYERL